MQPLQNFDSGLDERLMVLGEKSDCGFMSPNHFAAVDERAVVATGCA